MRCQGRLAGSSLQVFVVSANDVTSVSVYSGVDAIICINAFVLTCQPMESSAFSWQLESNYNIQSVTLQAQFRQSLL
jgi:hypothetical protein